LTSLRPAERKKRCRTPQRWAMGLALRRIRSRASERDNLLARRSERAGLSKRASPAAHLCRRVRSLCIRSRRGASSRRWEPVQVVPGSRSLRSLSQSRALGWSGI
jgi:hypothetical protein